MSVASPTASYESDALLAQYAEFHFGEPHFGVACFPQEMARLAIDAQRRFGNGRYARALDLGCATGRASLELAHGFEEVIGVDYSARFVQAAGELQRTGRLAWSFPDEGELVFVRETSLTGLGLADAAPRVRFCRGDAGALDLALAGFDLILAANLIDRLRQPRAFLAAIHERLDPGGLLVLASPYTWLPEFTPREEWLGGYTQDGLRRTTLDGLKDALLPRFDLVDGPRDVPFVIRETRRKFQHTLSEVTVWRRRRA
jgi:putative 4-mercaptohistidine N1-methyltranferase